MHLLLVPCHSVYLGGGPGDAARWALQPFQAGEHHVFLEHIRTGISLLEQNDNAVLCFSGGMTNRAAGMRSEAQGYLGAACEMAWCAAACTILY